MPCHHKIFNVSLKELEFTEEKLTNGSTCRIPIFVADACTRIMEQIDVEGIFRKAGSQLRQKEIRVSILQHKKKYFCIFYSDVHVH